MQPLIWAYVCFSRFWLLAIEDTSEVWQDRFIDTFQRYMDSNYRQASDRDVGHIRDLETYMEWRRENIGVWPTIVLYELDSDLPPEIYDHPLVQEICIDATDLVIIDNVGIIPMSMKLVPR